MSTESLRWSTQLRLASSGHNARLQGDKITLPQSALEALLAAAPVVPVNDNTTRSLTPTFDPYNPHSFAAERRAREALLDRQQILPHPLTFRLVNPENGRIVYAGIREFSSEEGEAGLSQFLLDALGISSGTATSSKIQKGIDQNDNVVMTNGVNGLSSLVTVHAQQLQKGTYVRLRPLEAGYDPEDWKPLLERYLRDSFTTLTKDEVLHVPGARHEYFKFLVDKFEPEGDGICIVDTDLEVDIEALNEEQARETLNRKLEKAKRAPGTAAGSSAGGVIETHAEQLGQVLPGEYVDYEVKSWNRNVDLEVCLEAADDNELDILVNPFSPHQRSKARLDEHTFSDLSGRPTKRLKLSHTNVDLETAESLFISVHATASDSSAESEKRPIAYSLTMSNQSLNGHEEEPQLTETAPDEVVCKNCHQPVPKRSLPLHEAFCYRNNVVCPKCKNVFLKNSDAWKVHWHCPHDNEYGNGTASKTKHDSLFHPPAPLKCPACDYEAFNVPILAHHRTTTCPGKEILCQFCHLVVPQQGLDDPSFTDAEVLLSGLTPHELADGARTTECHLCTKIVRLRDMRTHLLIHDRDRISRPKPKICVNLIDGHTIKPGTESRVTTEQLGLCDDCYAPLHGTSYDPEGKARRRRIERRLLQQLMGGCGKPWCHNEEWCRTGRKNSTGNDVVVSAKDALPIVKPALERIITDGDASGVKFCVDQAGQSRRVMAEMVAVEGEYDLNWCVKALEEERNDVARAKEWLRERAPRVGEVIGR